MALNLECGFSDIIQLCKPMAQFQFLMDQVHGNMVFSTLVIL